MAKHNLVVVESAAKAKTIEKFLGRGYTVRACLGHVRDLPTSKLGVDVTHGFQPQYVVPKDRRDLVKRLKQEVKGADGVVLATDPDREGEAIAWHLVSALGLDQATPVQRIEFHEITRNAILDAIKHPRTIDMRRVDAQQARRVLDRLIGYPVSSFLGRKVRRGLSAGRVQSLAVRIVVDREREIEAFEPREYWSLDALLAKRPESAGTFTASLLERDGQRIELASEAETQAVQSHLAAAHWQIADVREREQQRNPAAPFTTSTLQQEASRKLGFTAKRTMMVAQQLYEGVDVGGESAGLITYMRTDSVTIARSAQDEARAYIGEKYGAAYVPREPRVYRTRSKLAQEAHEAIRPTAVLREPASIKAHLSSDQARLYDLIWKRFVASQMASAIFDITTVEVDASAEQRPRYRFRATGSRRRFDGFLSVYREGRDDDEVPEEERASLPELSRDELLDLLSLTPGQHFTQPPPRYTEATLVKALEERGVGRPSTYAPTLSTIQDRGYVEREGRVLRPTEMGRLVTDLLVSQFPGIVDQDFTATMEERLDEVAQGQRPWVPVVEEFYHPLTADLERAEAEVERITAEPVATDEVCSLGHPMVIKDGRFGRFLACSSFPEHKETRPLPDELPANAPEERCSHGEVMLLRSGRHGPFYTSGHGCDETRSYQERIGVPCPLDGGDIVQKRSKRGKVFFGCSRWPECDWVSWYRPLAEPCPECGGMQVDMGRGRIRCLKHQPLPERRSSSAAEDDAGDAPKGASARAARSRGTGSGAKRRTSPAKRSRPAPARSRSTAAVA